MIWSADTWDIVYFLSFVKFKKVRKFHSLSFGGTVLSPPPYITRPLCIRIRATFISTSLVPNRGSVKASTIRDLLKD